MVEHSLLTSQLRLFRMKPFNVQRTISFQVVGREKTSSLLNSLNGMTSIERQKENSAGNLSNKFGLKEGLKVHR